VKPSMSSIGSKFNGSVVRTILDWKLLFIRAVSLYTEEKYLLNKSTITWPLSAVI